MTHRLILSDGTREDLCEAIFAPLRAFNDSHLAPSAHRYLAVELQGEHGETVGGFWGSTDLGWLFVDLLVVPEALRGQGIGRQLMAMAEDEARQRGCHGAWLDTFDFQARPFYESLGYVRFGELTDYPMGHTRYFMQKALAPIGSDGAA
jgi:GNAT superfamily N-acetyltransferase